MVAKGKIHKKRNNILKLMEFISNSNKKVRKPYGLNKRDIVEDHAIWATPRTGPFERSP